MALPSQRALVHPQLGWISGMCSDEAPHTEIDQHVLAAKNAAHVLEAERDRYRELADMMLGVLEAIWTGAMDGQAPDPKRLRERIDWYSERLERDRA